MSHYASQLAKEQREQEQKDRELRVDGLFRALASAIYKVFELCMMIREEKK